MKNHRIVYQLHFLNQYVANFCIFVQVQENMLLIMQDSYIGNEFIKIQDQALHILRPIILSNITLYLWIFVWDLNSTSQQFYM